MGKRRIHIDSLSIKLPHSVRGSERGITANIAREILTGIAEATCNRNGVVSVDSLSTNISARGLYDVSGQVSRSVAGEVTQRLGHGGRE